MSLVARIFGRQSGADLPPAFEADLARLKKVRELRGQSNWLLRLRYPDTREQLHMASKDLGDHLATCPAADRLLLVKAFAEAEALLPPDVRGSSGTPETPELRTMLDTGFTDFGRLLTDAQLADIHAHLRHKPVLLANDAHAAKEGAPSLEAVPGDKSYACYSYLDLWSSPHILETVCQDRLLDQAQGYLGCTPTLYSINAFWSLPNRRPHKASQVFHRDWEDYRSCVAFTLLTPVNEPEEGAHYYVETSHEIDRFKASMAARGLSEKTLQKLLIRDETVIAPTAMELFKDVARRFHGPAGRSFCADGYGLHRAVVPQTRPRLLLWFRFGNFYNVTAYRIALPGADRATARKVLARIPSTPRHQYIFRYLIEALSAV